MKLAVYEEIGETGAAHGRPKQSFFGPTLRLSRPVQPLFAAKPFVPATDVFVRDGDLAVRVELPGVDPTDLKVTVEDGYLVIRGEQKACTTAPPRRRPRAYDPVASPLLAWNASVVPEVTTT